MEDSKRNIDKSIKIIDKELTTTNVNFNKELENLESSNTSKYVII